jgi:hypothetical protein
MSGSPFRTLVLTMALAAGALVASSRTAKAQLPTEPADPGVRCAAKVGTGQYEFYLPGERATDVNGNKWVCGADGQWFRDYSSALTRASATVSLSASTYYVVAVPRASAVMR